MKFSLAAIAIAFAATAAAAPGALTYPGDMTVQQARDKCGDTHLSCCNKVSYGNTATDSSSNGILSGVLSNLLASNGAGSEGLGLFDQCSDLGASVIGATDLLNKKCQSNVACCQDSPSTAVSFHSLCFEFMNVLTVYSPVAFSTLPCHALLLVLWCKGAIRSAAIY